MEWLKSRVPNAAPPATPAPPKKRFAVTRSSDLRPIELPRDSTPAPSKPTVVQTATETPATPAPTPRVIVGDPAPKKSTASTTPAETPSATSKAKKVASEKAATTPGPIASKTTDKPATSTRLSEATTPTPSKGATPTPNRTAKTAPDSTPTPTKTAKTSTTPRPSSAPTIATTEPSTPKPTASTKPTATPTVLSNSKKSSTAKPLAASATPAATPTRSTPSPKSLAASTSAHDLLSVPAQTAKLSMATRTSTTSIVLPKPTPDPYRLPPIPRSGGGRYPWKTNIVTTVFWVGERPTANNPTPNHASSWDANWARSFGGYDNPDPDHRRNFIPVAFTPRQNPFYVALPYNDVTRGTTKPESRLVIPWFKSAFQREGLSVCRDRWVAVRNRDGKVGYAQWSDCGPFRTDHWQYVFGNERPRPNLNNGAGLDVSPALRDFLGLRGTDVTDWKFVEARDVPSGPWGRYGDNNIFAQRGGRGR